jgi:hypothetical protein
MQAYALPFPAFSLYPSSNPLGSGDAFRFKEAQSPQPYYIHQTPKD